MSTRPLAVCSWSLRPRNPAELLERLRLCSITRVQLALAPLVSQPDIWADAISFLRGEGITIQSGMLAMASENYSTIDSIRESGGVRPDAHWPDNLERARAVADVAQRYGVKLVTLHAGFLPHDKKNLVRATMLDRLGQVIDFFADAGASVAFETGQEHADTLQSVLHELNRPTVGVNFDPANMLLYGLDDPIGAFQKLQVFVRQVHAKDAIASGVVNVWGKETAIGQGQVPWSEFMHLVSTLPSDVAVVIEREGGDRRVEEVISAKRFLEPMMNRSV